MNKYNMSRILDQIIIKVPIMCLFILSDCQNSKCFVLYLLYYIVNFNCIVLYGFVFYVSVVY